MVDKLPVANSVIARRGTFAASVVRLCKLEHGREMCVPSSLITCPSLAYISPNQVLSKEKALVA